MAGALIVVVCTGLLATIFWDLPILLPAKLLVVLVHEMWHGVAAMASGAELRRIALQPGESGSTFIHGLPGGWPFIVSVSAGYLGSTLAGALLLNRGLAGSLQRVSLAVFALSLWYMSYLFTDSGTLAFWTGIGWAAVLCLAVILGRRISGIALLIVGTLFLWYCMYDLFDFSRDLARSDAGILADHLRGRGWVGPGESAAHVIAGFWVLIMGGILLAILLPPILAGLPGSNAAPEEMPQDPTIIGLPPDFLDGSQTAPGFELPQRMPMTESPGAFAPTAAPGNMYGHTQAKKIT